MLSVEEARRILCYDKNSGSLTWKVRVANCVHIGDTVGWVCSNGSKNYFKVEIKGINYRVHRLIWFITTGKWPNPEVDHVNGNGCDNRWDNLREVSHPENGKNQRQRADNTSGRTGVHWSNKLQKWVAQITYHGVNNYLGCFTNIEDAISVRVEAETKFGFHDNHGSKRPL